MTSLLTFCWFWPIDRKRDLGRTIADCARTAIARTIIHQMPEMGPVTGGRIEGFLRRMATEMFVDLGSY